MAEVDNAADSSMSDSTAEEVATKASTDSVATNKTAKTTPPPKKKIAAKTAPKKTSAKPTQKKTTPTRTTRPSVQGLFMVQVYSSPSLPDAEQWLRKLQARKVANPLISSQLIQGQTWYRVRFGKFTSQAQADKAARKLGFAKSWVVRLK